MDFWEGRLLPLLRLGRRYRRLWHVVVARRRGRLRGESVAVEGRDGRGEEWTAAAAGRTRGHSGEETGSAHLGSEGEEEKTRWAAAGVHLRRDGSADDIITMWAWYE